MVMIVLEKVPVSLRGELTRWLLELSPGVFVGRVSAMVRDKLWEMVRQRVKSGGGLLVHSSDCEQGFVFEICGATKRSVADFEGLSLLQVPE
jgi:CRISPR-associated protein Cas2